MIPAWLAEHPDLRATLVRPGSAGAAVDWPDWAPEPVISALRRAGLERPWRHQAEAAAYAHSGRPTMVATPTASGKSLAYLLPVLAATWGGTPTSAPPSPDLPGRRTPKALLKREHTALYLAPTKALAHDQARVCGELGIDSWRFADLDGDSSPEQRAWARDHATFLLTNPDLLHRSVLPGHQRWQGFLKSLRYVVIDEAHHYQGVFGMQVSLVLRRLRRLCRALGADPVVIGASATLADPAGTLSALTGVDRGAVASVTVSGAPRPETRLLVCRPEDPRSAVGELFGRLATEGVQTCAFVGSRSRAEQLAADARRAGVGAAAYRAGLLPHERRDLERALAERRLLAIASTSALELGVDVGGLDAVLLDGHPGDPTALWQRIGRAGRRERPGLAVLVAGDNPLDAWWCDHPDELLSATGAPPPASPTDRVLAPQLAAAAQEQPLTADDERWFGARCVGLADRLAAGGVLRRRAAGWFWTRPDRAVDSIDLRSCGQQVEVCEPATGRVIGTLDTSRADRELHPGAVYRHQGETWLVSEDAAADDLVYAAPARPGYLTVARSESRVTELHGRERPLGAGVVAHGPARVLSRVTGFLRLDEVTGQVWDETPLTMPERRLDTTAVWFELPASAVPEWTPARARAAAHALEHALTGLLGTVLRGDPRALSGWTETPTGTGAWRIGLHELVPGGSGLSAAGAELADQWLAAVLDRLSRCQCGTGCPRCVLATRCPDGNRGLDRGGALELARLFCSVAPLDSAPLSSAAPRGREPRPRSADPVPVP
ncbi:helicase [Enemella dayhoffiae]|uniref:Helicase n=1 Tax=Enemella dayhoffiae TaxID=2016507 RepID=A0A255H945_9ACTN|nr:DEAD/DEAH box helicase [Enemella dayhoffiae]OYO24141.1 helicase [Enemella dayhoffiae]